MRKPNHRKVKGIAAALILATVLAVLVTAVPAVVLVAILVLALLVIINDIRWSRWWLARRIVGRRVLVGNDVGTVTGLLRTQPGDYVELDLDRNSSPTTLPSRTNLDGEVEGFVIRHVSFKCPVEDVSFIAPERLRFWLPQRFDRR